MWADTILSIFANRLKSVIGKWSEAVIKACCNDEFASNFGSECGFQMPQLFACFRNGEDVIQRGIKWDTITRRIKSCRKGSAVFSIICIAWGSSNWLQVLPHDNFNGRTRERLFINIKPGTIVQFPQNGTSAPSSKPDQRPLIHSAWANCFRRLAIEISIASSLDLRHEGLWISDAHQSM